MALADDLLAAVIAAPDDEAARLVYADHLTEAGDPRGEFIQIQCMLGRTLHGASAYAFPTDANAKHPPSQTDLEKREKALLKKHQKAWLEPIRPYIRTWKWKNGFVDHVEADAAKFLDGVGTIFATTPLSRAELTGLKAADHGRFVTTESLRSLRSLSLAQQRIGPRGARLFHSPHFGSLHTLDAWGNPLADEGAATFATASGLGALRSLDVSRSDMTIVGLRALSLASFFPALTHLSVATGYRGGEAVGPELGTLLTRGESLVAIDVGGCHLGDDGVEAIANATSLPELVSLYLFGNAITERGALALARTKLPKLTEIKGLVGYESIGAESEGGKALRDRFGDGIS